MEPGTTGVPSPLPADPALLRDRDRWRALAGLAADMAFEVDADGLLTLLAPDRVLGRRSAGLLGQPVRALLAEGAPAPHGTMRQQSAWMRHADGGVRCMALTVQRVLDDAGAQVGLRGVGLDMTGRERQADADAALLRRAGLLDRVVAVLRQEVLPSRMMEVLLRELAGALGADGVAVLEWDAHPHGPQVRHGAGADAGPVLAEASELLAADADVLEAVGDRQVMACPAPTRFGEPAGVLAWRPLGGRAWDASDQALALSVTGLVRLVLEHEAIQRELARQARTDPLTGLLNRRAFVEEAARRIDRLDREGLPGTLVFVDLDRLKPLNDLLGYDAGDAALVRAAGLLRRTFRPADLVARLGGDEFALWLDGSDELTAAERAERLRTGFPAEVAHPVPPDPSGAPAGMTLSIGIACRPAGSAEDLDSLMERADLAMYEVKRQGGGQWRVSRGGAGGLGL